VSSANTQAAADIAAFGIALPGKMQAAVRQAQDSWDASGGTLRLWNKDGALWTGRGEGKWLGWLDIVERQLASISKFKALAAEIREDAFTHMLLLGMGGSSLCPEVFGATFGKQPGWPELLVLDSTDPAQIRSIQAKINPARTLFWVSSKSGATMETNLYMQYFFDETKKAVGDRAGHHFIAITDPGSRLEGMAEKLGFRRIYYGEASIGGRYSALSDFGLAPHAAAGLDTERLLRRAREMAEACRSSRAASNPGVALGLILSAAAAKFGRDKVTLLCSKPLVHLGAWLEQLLAESTGKQGAGLIPIDREPLLRSGRYGKDRIFACIKLAGDRDSELEGSIAALERSEQPVLRIVLNDLYDLGQVFFQWEIAAAVAASVLRVNAFDQPDVEASKAAARELALKFEETGSLAGESPVLEQDGIKLFADAENAAALLNNGGTLGAAIRAHVDRLRPGDYFALLAYLPMFRTHEEKLQQMRATILESKGAATVLGFGPRFLHSTGQLHKGGPNTGVFLQITCEEAADLPVPQQKYTFGVVKAAEARGDFKVLAERGRRALRVHLGKDVSKGLDRLRDLICAAVAH